MSDFKGHLLVVDDDENNRDILSRRLLRSGFAVEQAASGSQALDIIARQPLDLVLLNLEMPTMSGLVVLERLRASHPATKLPVIIVTVNTDRQMVVRALSLGANDFVSMPLDFPVILARVETQLSLKYAVDRIVTLEGNLRRRNDDLQQANERMKRSLEMASRMQQSLLPSGPCRMPGIQCAWLYRPCDELGGDIFNIFPLGPEHVGLYLLDVSGHGVPAALLSVTLSRVLATVPGQSSLVEKMGPRGPEPRRPREVVEALNQRFRMSDAQLQYFTVFYGVLDMPSRRLQYVSAGHPPALLLSPDGESRFVEGRNFAVGWIDDAEFEENELRLNESDRLYVYSDGLTEAMDLAGVHFGYDRLASVCREARQGPLQNTLEALLDKVGDFRGDAPAEDDISALALEMTA